MVLAAGVWILRVSRKDDVVFSPRSTTAHLLSFPVSFIPV